MKRQAFVFCLAFLAACATAAPEQARSAGSVRVQFADPPFTYRGLELEVINNTENAVQYDRCTVRVQREDDSGAWKNAMARACEPTGPSGLFELQPGTAGPLTIPWASQYLSDGTYRVLVEVYTHTWPSRITVISTPIQIPLQDGR